MADEFDPYADWLGITTPQRPPHHYDLLGLPPGEADVGKIIAAAESRMASIRKLQVGPRGRFTQQLLNELAAAKICLTEPRAKAAYDAALLRVFAGQSSAAPTFSAPVTPAPASVPFVLGTREAIFLPARPSNVGHSVAAPVPVANKELADERTGISRGWVLLGLFFFLVIVGTSAGGYVGWRQQRLARLAEIEAEEEAAMEEEEVPEEELPAEIIIAQEGNGDLSFPLSAAELSEDVTRAEAGGATVLSGWQSGSIARWKFRVIRPAIFRVEVRYAAEKVPVARWEFTSDEEVKTRAIEGTPGDDGVIRDEFFWRIRSSGEHVLELRAIHVSAGGTLSLHGLRMNFQQ